MLGTIETSTAPQIPDKEALDVVIDELLDFVVSKLKLPGGRLLYKYLTGAFIQFFELAIGMELVLIDDGSQFKEALFFELETTKQQVVDLKKRIRELNRALDSTENSSAVVSSDLRALKSAIKSKDNLFTKAVNSLIQNTQRGMDSGRMKREIGINVITAYNQVFSKYKLLFRTILTNI